PNRKAAVSSLYRRLSPAAPFSRASRRQRHDLTSHRPPLRPLATGDMVRLSCVIGHLEFTGSCCEGLQQNGAARNKDAAGRTRKRESRQRRTSTKSDTSFPLRKREASRKRRDCMA